MNYIFKTIFYFACISSLFRHIEYSYTIYLIDIPTFNIYNKLAYFLCSIVGWFVIWGFLEKEWLNDK